MRNTVLTEDEFSTYIENLLALADYGRYLGVSGLPEKMVVPNGLGRSGSPDGCVLPIYPEGECGTSEGRFEKGLFNLAFLTGFTSPGYKTHGLTRRSR